jgi:hypothetical protein
MAAGDYGYNHGRGGMLQAQETPMARICLRLSPAEVRFRLCLDELLFEFLAAVQVYETIRNTSASYPSGPIRLGIVLH